MLKSVICLESLYVMTLRHLNTRKTIESNTLLCNSIKKTKKRKIQTSQTCSFFNLIGSY